MSHSLKIAGLGDVLFCHATPQSETEMFTRLTPEPLLAPVFEGLGVDLQPPSEAVMLEAFTNASFR